MPVNEIHLAWIHASQGIVKGVMMTGSTKLPNLAG